jgi:hypothetical protein
MTCDDARSAMTDYVKAWQCIGCGMIEAPQTCIGVCEYRKAELVFAFEYKEALAQAAAAQQRAAALEAVVRQLAGTTPRGGEWERSYKALQIQARRALAAAPGEAPGLDGLAATDAMGYGR